MIEQTVGELPAEKVTLDSEGIDRLYLKLRSLLTNNFELIG